MRILLALLTVVIPAAVDAPCLPGGQGMVFTTGPNPLRTCETAEEARLFRSRSHQPLFEHQMPD
jgi:hypothetical protein